MCIRDRYASANGGTWSTTPLPNVVLAQGEYLLIKEADGAQLPLGQAPGPVSYTHLRAHETVLDLVCRLLLEKKKKQTKQKQSTTT